MDTYENLGPTAQKLGAWMARRCENGLPGHFGDDLPEALPGAGQKELKTALAELKADGSVELSPVIGPALPRVRTTYDLFVAADAAISRA